VTAPRQGGVGAAAAAARAGGLQATLTRGGAALAAANPGWRLLTREEAEERRVSLNAHRETVMKFVDNLDLQGEAARQVINSAAREMRQIGVDIATLSKPYVLVPEGKAPEDGEVEIAIPESIKEEDVAVFIGDDDDEPSEVDRALEHMAKVGVVPPQPPPAAAAPPRGGGAAAAPRGGGDAAARADGDVAMDSTLRSTGGGTSWVIESMGSAKAGAAAKRAAAPKLPPPAPAPVPTAPKAPLPTAGAVPTAAPVRTASGILREALTVPADASLRDKAQHLRRILAQHLGGEASLDRILDHAREETADSEDKVAADLGDRADLLLPIVHTLVDLEEALPLTEA